VLQPVLLPLQLMPGRLGRSYFDIWALLLLLFLVLLDTGVRLPNFNTTNTMPDDRAQLIKWPKHLWGNNLLVIQDCLAG
jgi:hypothetical protein